jgi:choline transport protein
MKKQFGTFGTLGAALCVSNSWVSEGATLTLYVSLGGSVTVIWGCLAAAAFTATVSLGLAELASAFPGAGGPYHYTFMVASQNNRKLLVNPPSIIGRMYHH